MDANIHTYMELRGSSWAEIAMMPYSFFVEDLKWKSELEEEKRKKIKDMRDSSASKAHQRLKQRNR